MSADRKKAVFMFKKQLMLVGCLLVIGIIFWIELDKADRQILNVSDFSLCQSLLMHEWMDDADVQLLIQHLQCKNTVVFIKYSSESEQVFVKTLL